jgi:hypothetical protein
VELGPLLLLGLGWLVVNALRKAGSQPPDSETTSRPRPRPPVARPPRVPVRTLPAPSGADATQREGARLEQLLRELGRTLDQASGPVGRAPDRRLPSAEEFEERDSLEVAAPDVQSLETDPRRGERSVVDQDDEAERVAARRIAAAEANAAPLTRADHKVFDARIRQEPADKTATRAYTTKQLREAVVWREILGPPVSLRGEGEG